MTEDIILVDKNDREVGVGEKMRVHQEGELLLQQRQKTKYHCPGLWSNTCCSHPRPGETSKEAARRRLKEEMGFDCQLAESHQFIYRAEFNNGLTEYEYDHVFVGKFDNEPNPNPDEVAGWKWISIDNLKEDISKNPEKYTPWFKIIVAKLKRSKRLI
mgnify:FL=1